MENPVNREKEKIMPVPIYIVMLYETNLGNKRDKNIRYFLNLRDAISYANRLNYELAETNNCEIMDLDNYYEIIAINEGK